MHVMSKLLLVQVSILVDIVDHERTASQDRKDGWYKGQESRKVVERYYGRFIKGSSRFDVLRQ